MAGAPVTDKAAARAPRRKTRTARAGVARIQSQSLLDVIDNVIDKGLAVDAEIVLGLADIDLIYLRVGALLAAADRVFNQPPKQRRKVAGAEPFAIYERANCRRVSPRAANAPAPPRSSRTTSALSLRHRRPRSRLTIPAVP